MLRKLKLFILTIGILFSLTASSQFYSTGSSPFTVKWKSINSEYFRLIFPEETDTMAQKFASTLYQMYPYTSYSLNHKPKPVDIILYNQSVLSNGYVVWAPKRMEVVTTTPQYQDAHNWMEQLALHEYRHVVQNDKLNQGFTKVLGIISGQMGVGAMMSFMPLWYLEGDAVVTETALTNSGRGRNPQFIQEVIAAEVQTKKRFSYDEFYLGSYKNYIPNYYAYGYQMVAWSRKEFGADSWEKVINNVARRPFTITPFYNKLKKETGLSKVGLYEHTTDYLHQKWNSEDSTRKESYTNSEEIKTQFRSKFVSYRFPYEDSDGAILALRSSIDDMDRIVQIKNNKERTILKLGIFSGSKIAYSDKYIAWQEIRYDMRWERKNYSVIKILDRENGAIRILKRKERHFSPDISPNSDKLALVKTNSINNTYIEIYNIQTKELLQKFEHPQKANLSYPVWLDEKHIAAIALSEKGKSIIVLNTKTSEWKTVFGPTFDNISYLSGNEKSVFFSYSIDGRENIYRLNLVNNEVERITSEAIGANYASVTSSKDTLIFSEYTASGYKPRKLPVDNNKLRALKEIKPYKYELAEAVAKQELINIQDSLLPKLNFKTEPYSKMGHTFKVHSWLFPFYVNLDDLPDQSLQLKPGFNILSQNSLSTVTSSLGLYYSDNNYYLRPTISFRMFYPVITFKYLFSSYSDVINSNVELNNLSPYQEFNTTISLPLNFSNTRRTHQLTTAVEYNHVDTYIAKRENYGNVWTYKNGLYIYKAYSSLSYQLNYYLASRLSYKDLRPKWGLNFYALRTMPYINKLDMKNSTLLLLSAYIPGLYRHQSFKFLLGGMEGNSIQLSLPRGYSRTEITELEKEYPSASAYKFSAEYAFPFLYPNLSIGPLAYFKRLHAVAFYDYIDLSWSDINLSANTFSSAETKMKSVGVEIGIESNFLRFFWTFVPTIQYSYRLTDQKHDWGFYLTTKYGFALGEGKSVRNY